MQKLSIVIPVYNEKETITEILKRVLNVTLPQNISKEIIVVDDGSTDGTRELLQEFKDRVKVILLERNQGKGAALKEGFRRVSGDYVLIQDADLEYNPSDLPILLEPVLKKQTEIVFGSRSLKKESRVPFSSWYFYGGLILTKVFNIFFNTRLTDFATCYKLFPSRFLDGLLKLPSKDFVYDVVELTHFLTKNSQITEVPISYYSRQRKQGKKLNWQHGVRCLTRMVQLSFNRK